MNEVWKDIAGYEGYYQVNNFGLVRSLTRVEEYYGRVRNRKGRMLKPKTNSSGYLIMHLRKAKDGLESWPSAHRLVAEAFIPNPENKPQVNHKDGVKTNNHVDNLEWATSSEQMIHAFEHDLIVRRGERLYSEDYKKEISDYYMGNDISIKKLSKMFSVSERTASRAVERYGKKKVSDVRRKT